MRCPHCNGSGELAATVGALIASARQAAGLTQEVVAGHAGISRAQLANLETDRTDTPTATLIRIAKAIGVPTGSLLP